MSIELFPYQIEGAAWLTKHKFALLADEMGLGKSAQVIKAIDHLSKFKRPGVFIVCPASAIENWKREFKKFGEIVPYSLEVVSYEYAAQYYKFLEAKAIDFLIIDECHYLKEPTAKRTQAIFGPGGLAHGPRYVWLLSGTPAPNNPAELWVMLHAFGYTSLKYEEFVDRYCYQYKPHPFAKKPRITGIKKENINEVRTMLSTLMLRRRVGEVLKELPKLHVNEHLIPLSEQEVVLVPYDIEEKVKEEYNALKLALPAEIRGGDNEDEDIKKFIDILSVMAKSVSTLRRYAGYQKVTAAIDMVGEELKNNMYQKIVIFCVHRAVAAALIKGLDVFGVASITGDTPTEKRQLEIDRFNYTSERDGKKNARVFIGNIRAAGVAINLTAAHHVLFVEQEWTPADNAQALKRCHRIGQQYPVFVRFLSLASSIDEKITGVLCRKTKELALLFDEEDKK